VYFFKPVPGWPLVSYTSARCWRDASPGFILFVPASIPNISEVPVDPPASRVEILFYCISPVCRAGKPLSTESPLPFVITVFMLSPTSFLLTAIDLFRPHIDVVGGFRLYLLLSLDPTDVGL